MLYIYIASYKEQVLVCKLYMPLYLVYKQINYMKLYCLPFNVQLAISEF